MMSVVIIAEKERTIFPSDCALRSGLYFGRLDCIDCLQIRSFSSACPVGGVYQIPFHYQKDNHFTFQRQLGVL